MQNLKSFPEFSFLERVVVAGDGVGLVSSRVARRYFVGSKVTECSNLFPSIVKFSDYLVKGVYPYF